MHVPRSIHPDDVRRIRGSETQSEFAQAVGAASFVTVSGWENGKTPSRVFRARLAELAEARGIPLNGKA